MKRLAAMTLLLALCIQPAAATDHTCSVDALTRAQALLFFHAGPDDRIAIEPKVTALAPLSNPAGQDSYNVLQVWGYIYKGRYRMRFIYGRIGNDCLLVGQEILEYANL